ncbi:MAG: hypothetical protein QW263_06485, partial [Nitrososphaerota archaeon]
YWMAFRRYQKEEDVEGVRVIFDFVQTRNQMVVEEMLQQVTSVQVPAAVLLVRSSGRKLEFWLSLNRQALSSGLSPPSLVDELRSWRQDVRIEASERTLRGEVESAKVGDLYGAVVGAIRKVRSR